MKNCTTCHSTYPDDYTHCPRDGTALRASELWSEGALIREKYRVLSQIGKGGMAAVYKAQHVHFRELRALKVISADLARDAKFVQRFMQEAVLTRRLQHPNAVRVDDIDKAEDGRPFMVMEYIEGKSLKDVMIHESPLPVERACRIARQVADALEAAHQLHMVHRDIKPANVVLIQTPEGEQAKVLDFGIAKAKEASLDGDSTAQFTLTGAGMVVGTPAYMSPEQAKGKRGDDVDGRSDLYSLGVVMYQMLTGDLPLKADSELQLMMAHISTTPVPILSRRSDLPEPLARLVMQCLEKNPDDRPSSARAFSKEILACEQELTGLHPAGQETQAGGADRTRVDLGGAARLEAETVAQEEATKERRLREEAERLLRIAEDRAEQEIRAREEAERQAEAARERERAEQERLALERAEQERVAREHAEAKRRADEQAEKDRLARERAEQELRAREEAHRQAEAARERERAEQERLARERAEQERAARERAEQERLARERAEAKRKAEEKAAAEQRAREQAEQQRRQREAAARAGAAVAPTPKVIPPPSPSSKGKIAAIAGVAAVAVLAAAGYFYYSHGRPPAGAGTPASAPEQSSSPQGAGSATTPPAAPGASEPSGTAGGAATPTGNAGAASSQPAAPPASPPDRTKTSPETAADSGRQSSAGKAAAAGGRSSASIPPQSPPAQSTPARTSSTPPVTPASSGAQTQATGSNTGSQTAAYAAGGDISALGTPPAGTVQDHVNKGSRYLNQGQIDLATKEFQTALQINPNDGGAHTGLGAVWVRLSRWNEAIAEENKAIALNPNDAYAHLNLASALVQTGKVDEALKEITTALRIAPEIPGGDDIRDYIEKRKKAGS